MTEIATFGDYTWACVVVPSDGEIAELEASIGLDGDSFRLVSGATHRPTLAVVGEQVFLGLDTVRYRPDTRDLELERLTIAIGPTFVVISSDCEEPSSEALRRAPSRAREGGVTAALGDTLDVIVDQYVTAIELLDHDIKAIEKDVIDGKGAASLDSITRTRRAVADLEHMTSLVTDEPLDRLLRLRAPSWVLENPSTDLLGRETVVEFDTHLRRIAARVRNLRDLLDNSLNAIATQVGIRQNEDARKISAWVGIYAIPTLIAGIYGMNFEHMPELTWTFGYPLSLGLMALVCVVVHWRFRRNGWL